MTDDWNMEAITKALDEARRGGADAMLENTHLAARQGRGEDWGLSSESAAQRAARAAAQPAPLRDVYGEIEAAYKAAVELGADTDELLAAIRAGELADLEPAARIDALAKTQVSSARWFEGDMAGALEVLGGSEELLEAVREQVGDEFDEDIVSFAQDLAIERYDHALVEAEEVFAANPNLSMTAKDMIAFALENAAIPEGEGETKRFLEGTIRAAGEADRVSNVNAALDQIFGAGVDGRDIDGLDMYGNRGPQVRPVQPDFEKAVNDVPATQEEKDAVLDQAFEPWSQLAVPWAKEAQGAQEAAWDREDEERRR